MFSFFRRDRICRLIIGARHIAQFQRPRVPIKGTPQIWEKKGYFGICFMTSYNMVHHVQVTLFTLKTSRDPTSMGTHGEHGASVPRALLRRWLKWAWPKSEREEIIEWRCKDIIFLKSPMSFILTFPVRCPWKLDYFKSMCDQNLKLYIQLNKPRPPFGWRRLRLWIWISACASLGQWDLKLNSL